MSDDEPVVKLPRPTQEQIDRFMRYARQVPVHKVVTLPYLMKKDK